MENKQTKAAGRVLSTVLLTGALMWMGTVSAAEKVFYRYLNDQGVKVLDHSIPPKYAQKGYEVVSLNGHVIKVVPPTLPKDELTKLETNRRNQGALEKWDKQLRRRYSSVADIEAAKARKLSNLDGNIAILRSNINSLVAQIEDQQSQAANIERAGRAIPESMLKVIDEMQLELEDTEELVRLRLEEYKSVSDKYDRDKARFREITER